MRTAAAGRRRSGSYTPTAYDTLVLSDSPVGYWAPTSIQALDLTGNGRHATAVGSLTTATMPGGGDSAAVFGGSSYLEIADNDAFSVSTTGALTIEAWIRPDVVEFTTAEDTGYVHWLGKGVSGQHEYVARMYSLTNTETRPNRISGYAFNLAGGLGTGSYFQDAVTAGAWIHYTLVINTTTSAAYPNGYTKIYKNGIQRDQDDLFSTASVVPANGTAPLRIGTRDLASYFQGAIGKVAVYNYEVSQARILAHVRNLVPPASGSAAFVRTIGAVAASTAGTTLVIPVTASVAAGQTVIVRAGHDWTSGAPSCVDSKGNTYTRDRTGANTGTTLRLSQWSAPTVTPLTAGDTITVTTTSVTARTAVASEFSGILTASPVDVQNGSAGTSTAPQMSGGMTTLNANDVLVATVLVEGPDTDAFTEDTVLGLYNQTARIGSDTGGAADTNVTLNCANRSVSSAANFNYVPTLGTSRNWIEALIAYKATGSTVVSETFTGTDSTVVTSESYCNFDGSFSTLTEHTSSASNPSSNWMMDTGTLTRKSGWGWTGKASTYGDPYFFRCRTRTQKATDTTVEFDYKVASWASGTFGTNSSADGTAAWFRYQTQWGPLYEVYIDKFDNKIGVKRKIPAIGYTGTGDVSNNGVYYTLKSDASCPVIGAGTLQATYAAVGSTNITRNTTDTTGAGGTSYHFKLVCKTLSTDKVQFQIFRDSVLVWSATDDHNDCVCEENSTSLATDLANSRYNTSDSRWNAATMAHPVQVAGYSGMRCDNAQAWFDNFTVVDG